MEILAKGAFTQKENIFLAERQIRTANLSEHRACTTRLSPIKGPDKIHKCRFTIDMLQLNKKRSREHSLVL